MPNPQIAVTHASLNGVDMSGATSRENAPILAGWFAESVDAVYVHPEYRVLFSSYTGAGVPVDVVTTWKDGTRNVSVRVNGTALGYQSNGETDRTVPFFAGVIPWVDAGDTYFAFINGSVGFPSGLSTTGLVNLNFNCIGNNIDSHYTSFEGCYDDVLFWAVGNTLSDEDIFAVYLSYFYTEVYPVGFDSAEFGTPHVAAVVTPGITCLQAYSIICDTAVRSELPCLEGASSIGCIEAFSTGPGSASACIC